MRSYFLVFASLLVAAGCDSETSYGLRHPDLYGRVTIDGKPASGITVAFSDGSTPTTVKTDANGQYVFGQLPFGPATVSVRGLPDFVVVDRPTQQVDLGQQEFQVNFNGYSSAAVSGHVLWEYAINQFKGVSGVSAHVEEPTFPVGDVTTTADGSYRFPRVPGYQGFPVVLGSLPGGFAYKDGNRWMYTPRSDARGLLDTTLVTYQPSKFLRVEVLVDGRPYQDVMVQLATPIPLSVAPGLFMNMPAMPIEVRISGFPSSITFDATVKIAQMSESGATTVTFTGYTPEGNRPPVATILAPANGATFVVGTPITFRGRAIDPEDGALSGSALTWLTSGETTYGSGEVLTVSSLAVGQHHISLHATDSRGGVSFANIDITVVAATGGRVAGTITISKDAAASVRVELSTKPVRSATTDSQGRYVFDGVPAGTYTVTVQPVECAEFPTTSRSVTVAEGTTTIADFAGASVYCYNVGHTAGKRPVP